jgi:SAM-dependent methyltransferase
MKNSRTKENITIESYNKVAGGYADYYYHRNVMQRELDYFIDLLPHKSRVLDLGCGPGHDANYLVRKGICVVGIDLSCGMIAIAKRRVQSADFYVMDIKDGLSGLGGKFGGIWACSSLLHIERQYLPEVIRELYRVLKKGGIIYISLKHGKGEGYKTENRPYGKVIRYFTYYNTAEIAGLLENQNFKIKKLNKRGRWISIFANKVY